MQYTVEQETGTFTQVADSEKDSVSFEIGGEVLASFKSSDIQGNDILLSFKPASSSDQEIFDSYSSIFDVPAYAVYMKPVLLVDGEVVAEGEEYLETTLGTKSSFTIHISSGGQNTSVTNDVTTGSMYAVTMDSQNITAAELQNIYDEVAVLKDSVTEENVYSEEYLGKLLNLAGKLYFAQVDIADTIAADMYDVAVTRSLSEGITGYEVRTNSLYGQITGLSEGSLYIDVDTDSHSVVSLEGEEDVPRQYFMSTGMISSLYESTVWEEITGEESVSTISILAKASEENIDILLISKDNLSTEIEKLNTDSTTKQSIINAVNSGKIVTIPAEDVTMGDWSGIGYIVTNPETGAGAYMISGGLNGGSVVVPASITYMVGLLYTIYMLSDLFAGVTGIVYLLLWGGPFAAATAIVLLALTCIAMIFVTKEYSDWTMQYFDFLLGGDIEAAYDMMYGISSDIKTYADIIRKFSSVVIAIRILNAQFGDVFSRWVKEIENTVFKAWADFNEYVKKIGRSRLLSDNKKVELIKKAFVKVIDKTDISIVRDIKYIKGFDAEGNVIYDWPEHMGFDMKTVESITRNDGLPAKWDRYGSMKGSNFADVPLGGKYTYNERALPYIENEAAYHAGTFNNATYFDKIDAIKAGDLETLNNILESEGIEKVSRNYFDKLKKGYTDYIAKTTKEMGKNIDATYGLKGTAAKWEDMSGGAGQIVTPFDGITMKELGIMKE